MIYQPIRITAFIETVILMTLAAVLFPRVTIFVGATLAPFALFRSPESVEWGRRQFKFYIEQFKPVPFGVLRRFIPIVAKVISIRIRGTIRFFPQGVRCLPNNWATVALCTTLWDPVELVPGAGTVGESLKNVSDKKARKLPFLVLATTFKLVLAVVCIVAPFIFIDDMTRVPISDEDFLKWAAAILCWIIALWAILAGLDSGVRGILIIFSGLYKFGLKASVWVWLPIILAASYWRPESTEVPGEFRVIRPSSCGKAAAVVAVCFTAFFSISLLAPDLVHSILTSGRNFDWIVQEYWVAEPIYEASQGPVPWLVMTGAFLFFSSFLLMWLTRRSESGGNGVASRIGSLVLNGGRAVFVVVAVAIAYATLVGKVLEGERFASVDDEQSDVVIAAQDRSESPMSGPIDAGS